MKKFLLGLSCFAFGFICFAEVQQTWSGDKLTEIKTKAQEKFDNAKSSYDKVRYGVQLELLTADLKSFDDAKKIEEAYHVKYPEFVKNHGSNCLIVTELCLIWSYSDTIKKDAFKYAIEIKKITSIANFCVYNYTILQRFGYSDKEIFKMCEACLTSKDCVSNSAWAKNVTPRVFDRYMFLLQTIDILDDEAKASLKKLNRIYSQKLIEDKATWEPIVAKIRIALETY